MERDRLLADLEQLIAPDQIVTDHAQLYDAAADRYKKYAKAKGVLDNPLPLAIVYPRSTAEVAELLAYCNTNRVNVIPRSGKTATEGGLENWKELSVVIDGSLMNEVVKIDTYNMQATVQAGVKLQDLDDRLRELGYTTGHSPQSKPVAEYGGLVATRSIGQFSTLYGGIEDMVVGLECVFPDGQVCRIKNVSRRAAGPDLKNIVIGNEGTLCYITEVTVKIFRYYPENTLFFGWLVEDVETGLEALREVVTQGYRPSVARVYSEEDANQHFAHFHKGLPVLIFTAEGPSHLVEATGKAIREAVGSLDGVVEQVDSKLIADWFNNLNWTQQSIDDEVQDMIENDRHDGYTTEISGDWETIPKIYHAVTDRIRREFPRADDLTMLGGHSSHSYINGTNMYFVYNYNINCEPEDEFRIYHHPLQTIIVEETLKLGGSMVHHHGIGKFRSQWTKQEHGSAYYMLEKLKQAFDPNGVMNFGSIYYQEQGRKYLV